MTSARARTLEKLVKENGWTYGAELGVYEGATTDHLLSTCPQLRMVGVDVWQPIEGGPKDKNTGFSPKAANVIAAAFDKAMEVKRRHGRRFLVCTERTTIAPDLPGIRSSTFDFVFVDASHVTADVVADVREWLPLVRSGGMVLGHDADWPAIQAALDILATGDGRFSPQWRRYYDGNVWGVRA